MVVYLFLNSFNTICILEVKNTGIQFQSVCFQSVRSTHCHYNEWNSLLLLNAFKHCCICAVGSRAASCGEPAAAWWIRSVQRAGQQCVDSTRTPQTLWSATRCDHQPRKLHVQPQPKLWRAQRCGAGGVHQTTQCPLAGAWYCCAHKHIQHWSTAYR